MYIYHSKLCNDTSFNHAVSGNFSGIRNNVEIVVSRHRVLELYVVDEKKNTISIYCSEYVHFVVRSMTVMNWKSKDILAIASDSGQAFVLYYSPEKNCFLHLFKKTYGMPVCLPEVPGQFIAYANGGIAVGALAENYSFYSLAKQDLTSDDNLLTVTQERCIAYDLIGIEHKLPLFASLEVYCEEGVDHNKYIQYLKVYEVNFRTKKVNIMSYPLPHHGNKLIYVPEGRKSPCGIIVCYEDKLTFKSLDGGNKEVTRFLPQRKKDAFNAKKGFILTSSTIHQSTGVVTVLAQSEQGDLFSITVGHKNRQDLLMNIIYIDTLPVAAALCMVAGKLFLAAEFGDNYLYDIKSLGNEKEMIPFKKGDILVTFVPRKLENLKIVAILKCKSPVMQSYVSNFACNNLKQFIFACGHGPSSTLRFQRYGVKVSTMFDATPPALSNSVWSVSEVIRGRTITYIVVSLVRATMVLALDEYMNVDNDNAFKDNVPTLDCANCSRNSIIQVYHTGFRLIKNNRFTEYNIKKKIDILRCALHGFQIALALVDKDGMYFEVQDKADVSFKQMKAKFSFKSTVMCMGFISRVAKAKHLVVCFENCMEIYSVDLVKMVCLTTFALEHIPESIAIVSCEENEKEFNSIINIGYQDGTLQRIAVNEEVIKSEYSMKLGTRPVKLCVGEFSNNVAVIAVSNRAWISFYSRRRMFTFAPLDYKDQIDDVAFFDAKCSAVSNLVVMSNKQLRVLSLRHWESFIEDTEVRLTYTPNIFIVNPVNDFLIISETNRRPPFYKEDDMTPQKAMDLALNPPKEETPAGPKPKKKASVWDSLLHIFDPIEKETVFKEPLPINETAVSMSLVRFGKGTPLYLLVGVKRGLMLEGVNPESLVHIYEVSGDGKSFTLANNEIVEDVPHAICPTQGYVLMGVGNLLCLYGFKHSSKTLVRCAVEESQRPIHGIWARGPYFIVKTSDQHLTYGYLEVAEASLVMIHEDRFMRAVTCLCYWDDHVIFVANRKSVSAVLLPVYEGADEKPPATTADITKLMEKMRVSDPRPSKSRPNEPFPEPGDWIFSKGPASERPSTSKAKTPAKTEPSFKTKRSAVHIAVQRGAQKAAQKAASSQAGPSTSKAGPSSQAGPSTSKAGPSSQAGPSTSKAGPSSQAGPSTSKAGPSSQAGPSTSKAGPSTSKAGPSTQAGPSTSKAGPSTSKAGLSSSQAGPSASKPELLSPSGSILQVVGYRYPFMRFMEKSYNLVTHKVGEYIQSIQKATLIEGGRELIVYTTMSGTVGVLVPFLNETHYKFFGPLEYLTFKFNPLLSTDWLAPLNPSGKDIYEQCYEDQVTIDGSVCDSFLPLLRQEQDHIAKQLGASVLEILQKVEEMKRTLYF